MKWVSLFKICSAMIICLLIIPVFLHYQNQFDQFDGFNYIASSLRGHGQYENQNSGVPEVEVGDKIIVMASLESENTSWVADKLPEYAELKTRLLY